MAASCTNRLATTRFGVGLAVVSLAAAMACVTTVDAAAAPSCAAFTSKVYDQLNPATQAQSLSATVGGYVAMQARGFTTARAETMAASPTSGSSLVAVHRLYRAAVKNYFYSFDAAEISRAVQQLGYVDQGVVFYAGRSSATCLNPVRSYYHPTKRQHRFTVSSSEGATLVSAGWRQEKVRFYLGKPSGKVFTIAVIPDTQPEVWVEGDPRFAQRTGWLTANKQALGLQFVTHTGDIVDWDTPYHDQYVRARAALSKLNGQVRYSVSLGNHDTAAVGVGGSAADPPNTWKMVRDTTTANRYLNQGTAALAGAFEAGKIDNTYHTFAAGGRQWLMLNLELWPRKDVIGWADRVLKAHPAHNAMVVTHSFMLGDGTIYQRSDYGATSPQYLYDQLLKVNPNVKMIFSGHTGTAAHREFTGVGSNRMQSFLLAMHDKSTNPTRLVEINTGANTVSSAVYSPYTKSTYPGYEVKARPAGWVR